MPSRIIPRKIILLLIFLFIGSLISQSKNSTAQVSVAEYMKVGDSIKYSFKSTGAYIPYGDQDLFFRITNITDPSNILVDILYGEETIDRAILLNQSVKVGWYILNNNSLRNNWQICPLQNTSASKIYEYWVSSNLRNVSEYYNDVQREALELLFCYDTFLDGKNYSIDVRWLWDYNTGILLNNSVFFNDTTDPSLSGLYEQYLVETSIWTLSARIIPGYPIIWTIVLMSFGLGLILIVSKNGLRNHHKKTIRTINKNNVFKVLGIILLLFGPSLVFFNRTIPFTKATPQLIMPHANVLLFSNKSESAIAVSLGLDDRIEYSLFLASTNTTEELLALDFTSFDVIIADGYLPSNESALHKIKSNINGTEYETSLIFFGGNYSQSALLEFSSYFPVEFVIHKDALNISITKFYQEQSGFLEFATMEFYSQLYSQIETYEIHKDDVQVAVSEEQKALSKDDQSMYITRIAWQSTPLLYERILTYAKKPGAITLIEVPDTKEPLIVTWEKDWDGDEKFSQVIFISPGVSTVWDYNKGEENEWNTPFKLWPYFNYMLYMMVYDCKGLEPDQIEMYADWPYSPIPHRREAIIWMVFVGSLWVFNFTLFFVLRKKSKKRDLAKSNNSLNLEESSSEDTKGQSSK
ncbi:MAG: hypothetical protein JW776_05395 [Candidatus Lokiarchaeota archaeon]|nr:hypothetical protein [Candidatus Lokiarchaeota archaeon]